ncbi:MAG: YihY/virulence factor BrkB family protein [Erythrobacter sp.]|uniref:YihY/virulence factor BrkB family protein n=1 Tax=Erythrobacter sp. TaxID=1042 RepID=UPI0025DB9F5E|nr:YihY/virulence factor BrkB family protein [Erythrobacter sp.]MCM0000437.1 YihY/virulence factor BrkB family protein [Erythrobacter sp.]
MRNLFTTRPFAVIRRAMVGTFNDGFIHAGNLAYLSMLAIFPFFILGAALFDLIGGRANAEAMIDAVARALPSAVASVIEPVAEDVIYARSGWLLWLGAAVGLWTVSSLIETIRDILRRAYRSPPLRAFWMTRLVSAGLILAAVVLLMLSLFAQVVIGAAQEVILAAFPRLAGLIATLSSARIVPALGLALSLHVLFATLTPPEHRKSGAPRWPGALFTTLWWIAVAVALPVVLRLFFTYDLTYGSLAGAMVTLLFFWLVGLGLVIGAELNAALALEGQDMAHGEASEEKA